MNIVLTPAKLVCLGLKPNGMSKIAAVVALNGGSSKASSYIGVTLFWPLQTNSNPTQLVGITIGIQWYSPQN